MTNEVVYLTKRMPDGTFIKPMVYDKAKYEARKKYIFADGWMVATKDLVSRFYDIEEAKPEPTPPKPTKKAATKKTEE